jgi:hypothetical protein
MAEPAWLNSAQIARPSVVASPSACFSIARQDDALHLGYGFLNF